MTGCAPLTLPRQKNTMARHTRLPVHSLKAAPRHNQLKYQVVDTQRTILPYKCKWFLNPSGKRMASFFQASTSSAYHRN